MFETFERLSQFMRRARIVEVGRDRLLQVKSRLQFMLVTEDLSDNSMSQLLREFDGCKIYRCLSLDDIERYFGLHGTKVIGFRRHPLSAQAMNDLRGHEVRPFKPMVERPKVAVLGASGIGRHHANWWNMEGADVVAFLGSNGESVSATTGVLKELFGFAGRGYVDLNELIAAEKPDIVDVCLPPKLHYDACRVAMEAGCNVLCEKPFVFDDALSRAELDSHGEELMRMAYRKGVRLGICTQYVMAVKEILALWQESHPGEAVVSFDGNLVSPTRNRPPVPDWTWVDLAPHMLGAVQVLSGCGTLDSSTLKRRFEGHLAEADFVCRRRDGSELSCHIRTFHTDEEPMNIRQIAINGALYDIGGRKDEQGVFQMDIKTPEGTIVEKPDMLRLLLRSFMRGKVEVSPHMALQNMDWLMEVMMKA